MARVFRIPGPGSDRTAVAAAASVLREGGIVVFPTETVYGVGVDIRNAAAARLVFAVKGRPGGMPLMAHCATEGQFKPYVSHVPDSARRLMQAFWPGPLAILLQGSQAASGVVTGGLGTLGVRMVAHPVARALILELGAPLAGTSANPHGQPATSRFDRIDPALLGQVDVAFDCGTCGSDVPSTVVDMTVDPPRLVRTGVVPATAIEAVLGRALQN